MTGLAIEVIAIKPVSEVRIIDEPAFFVRRIPGIDDSNLGRSVPLDDHRERHLHNFFVVLHHSIHLSLLSVSTREGTAGHRAHGLHFWGCA